uniref:Uncharacterized protein n=1 Tax=Rhizophora mucronata TaxID=61149 RepID=A0A2P2QHT0_RHIMU
MMCNIVKGVSYYWLNFRTVV